MVKVNHILAINCPFSAGELLDTIDALNNCIHDYENYCLIYKGNVLCMFPVGYQDGLNRALAIVESLLIAHAESEHYGDYHNNKPAEKN